jgi:HlyD family secretion protein
MPVTFTVDSYRGQTFRGSVDAVRLNAQNQNSVVTYPVWIVVPNEDLRLRPSMTANLQIVVDTASGVLRVPNEALRFRPTSAIYGWLNAAPPPGAAAGVRLAQATESPVPAAGKVQQTEGAKIDDLFAQAPRRTTAGQIWVYDEAAADPTKMLRPIAVSTGLADVQFTEIMSGDVAPGLDVITGVTPPQSAFKSTGGGIFQQPQRGFNGMTPAGPAPLPTLNQPRGAPRGRG